MEYLGLQQVRGVITPPALSTPQHDYNPARLAYASVLRQGASADVTITGMVPKPGQVLRLFNVSAANTITLVNQSVSSAAANRFAFGCNITLLPDDAVTLWYDDSSARWRAIEVASRLPAFEVQPEAVDFDPFADVFTMYDASAGAVRKISPKLMLLGGRHFTSGEADFCGAGQYQDWSNGSVYSNAAISEPGHPGMNEYGVIAGWAGAAVPNAYAFMVGTGRIGQVAIFKTGPVLSTSGARYALHSGLHNDNHQVDPYYGVTVRYRDDINGGKWQLRASIAGNEVTADTGVMVAANTWYRIELDISASAAIAGVNGSAPVSVTSQIPLYDEMQLIGAEMLRPNGTESRNFFMDYAGYIQALATKR